MTRFALAALLAAMTVAPAAAQDRWGVAVDLGLGAEAQPEWMGAEDLESSPWVIVRNLDLLRPGEDASLSGPREGFRVTPTLSLRGGRDSEDYDRLRGLDDIDRTVEAGARFRYTRGATSAQLIIRKGIGGHDGLAGSFGVKHRITPNDRLIVTPGIEAKFGDRHFTNTFFGVSSEESARSGYEEFDTDGGIYSAGVSVEARYELAGNLALVGEVEYSELVGDAADSPFIETTSQPAIRVGIVNRFSFRF